MSIHQIPIFQKLEDSKTILLAGAGGGFDVYAAIPLYFSLKAQGKKVVLANLSFTFLPETTSEKVAPYCYKIQAGDRDLSQRNYFPEKYLKLWFIMNGETVDVYAFENTGVNPLKNAYNFLIKEHEIDSVVLVDGGTDSLMFGDEEGLGTPQEDMCSIAAVHRSRASKKYLLSIGFGIDHFHGVSHYRFLENVAEIMKTGGYLGAFQLTKEMEAARKYIEAINFANERMPSRKSIVSNSIVSSLEGEYGDYHRINRTEGSQLWINPLMTIYWCFELNTIIRKIKYYDYIKDVNSISEFKGQLSKYRNQLNSIREKKDLPI